MDPRGFRSKEGPESKIQTHWNEWFENTGWMVERFIGNHQQFGIPDNLLAHPQYGQRWVDYKVSVYGKLTYRQRQKWPVWEKYGVGIWILDAPHVDACTIPYMIEHSKKLFLPPNWRDYWKDSYDEATRSEDEIDDYMTEVGW